MLRQVGEAVARAPRSGPGRGWSSSGWAARRGRTASGRWRSALRTATGNSTFSIVCRSCQSTSQWNSSRAAPASSRTTWRSVLAARSGSARIAPPPAARSAGTTAQDSAGAGVAGRLEVERVDVPGVVRGRPVVVELEHDCPARPAPRGRRPGARSDRTRPSRPSSARSSAVLEHDRGRPRSTRDRRPGSPPQPCRCRTRAPPPRPARRPAAPPPRRGRSQRVHRRRLAAALPQRRQRPARHRLGARQHTAAWSRGGILVDQGDARAGQDVVELVQQQQLPQLVQALGRIGRSRPPRMAAAARNSASCSARSPGRVAQLDSRLAGVGAAVVLEVELAHDRRQLAGLGLQRRRRTPRWW